MPSEPRLFDPTPEPDGQAALPDASFLEEGLDLPADLAELAEQLACESRLLAERYPARSTSDVELPAAQATKASRRLLPVVGIAGSVAAAMTGWLVVRPTVPEELPAPVVSQVRVSWSHGSESATASDESSPAVVPADLFRTLSGAEQEAVLDLVEEHSLGQASFSI